MSTSRACIVTASGQNVFFGELLEALRDSLERAGVATETAVDHFPPVQDGLAYVFVPHEYLPLTMPKAHPSEAQLKRSVAVCTEQPGTAWFDLAAEIASRCAAAVDINHLGVAELRRRGVSVRFMQLGYVAAWDRWHGTDAERPIDLVFIGGYTPRRARALAQCGRMLVDRRASLHVAETVEPHLAGSPQSLSGAAKWDRLASSRAMLNVHRSEHAYLEWQRVIEAIANGCVVVSEHSLGVEPLVPGEHFVSVGYAGIPQAVDALLRDDEALARISSEAYRFVREQLPLDASIGVLAERIEQAGAAPVPAQLADVPPVPSPRLPDRRTPEHERVVRDRTDLDVVRGALKRVVLEQQDLRRALRRLQDGDAEAHDEVAAFGPYEDVAPRVSVVLTVFNYERHVREAIASVALSTYDEGLELVVVDDASTDGSLGAVQEQLAAVPWLAAKVIHGARNRGLGPARNRGLGEARGEYAFILDADNAVYPHSFERLSAALDAAPDAAFAYGIIEAFEPSGPSDVMSWLPWDPGRLRYGNYVDAMAMLRRDVVLGASGYTNDPAVFGWEDFALWCELAERGLRGVAVPEILARYRLHPASMLSLTNLEGSAAWAALVTKFPFLLDEPAPATAAP